jgi:hypothetical protein
MTDKKILQVAVTTAANGKWIVGSLLTNQRKEWCFMRKFICFGFVVLLSAACGLVIAQSPAAKNTAMPQGSDAPSKEQAADIAASLAKLSPEDREIAEAQGFCPIQVKNRLGVMGTPVKVMINNQPVFLCCNGCRAKALANPDKTLAMVASLKAKVADAAISANLAKLSPEDRQLVIAQGYCPVMKDNRLGAMGAPVKVMIKNQAVFLCCADCEREAQANPEQTLATVADLKSKVAEAAHKTMAGGKVSR